MQGIIGQDVYDALDGVDRGAVGMDPVHGGCGAPIGGTRDHDAPSVGEGDRTRRFGDENWPLWSSVILS